MSATDHSHQHQSLTLEDLNGAKLTYEDAEGETVVVEFDE